MNNSWKFQHIDYTKALLNAINNSLKFWQIIIFEIIL